jgi:hypothetical protein
MILLVQTQWHHPRNRQARWSLLLQPGLFLHLFPPE